MQIQSEMKKKTSPQNLKKIYFTQQLSRTVHKIEEKITQREADSTQFTKALPSREDRTTYLQCLQDLCKIMGKRKNSYDIVDVQLIVAIENLKKAKSNEECHAKEVAFTNIAKKILSKYGHIYSKSPNKNKRIKSHSK